MSEQAKDLVVDKSKWPAGPWTQEPDKVTWTTRAGLVAMVARNNSGGALCGYIAVPPGHPLHGVDFCSDDDVNQLRVHGGVSYTESCRGFICHVPAPGEPENVWWIGFDCAHSGDASPKWDYRRDWEEYRPLAYVQAECESLAEQLVTRATWTRIVSPADRWTDNDGSLWPEVTP